MNTMVSYDEPEEKEKDRRHAGPVPIEPQVSSICFNADGSAMATIDVRPDIDQSDTDFHCCLKIWERLGYEESQEDEPLFDVEAEIDRPHRYQSVYCSQLQSC